MPWSFKAVIILSAVSLIGASLMAFAGFETGWQSLSHFAYGTLTAGVGLAGALLFSIICAVTSANWRRRSMVAAVVAALLLGGLFLFARTA